MSLLYLKMFLPICCILVNYKLRPLLYNVSPKYVSSEERVSELEDNVNELQHSGKREGKK
jgi:hypothetical protein